MQELDSITKYIWLAVVSIIGGFVGFVFRLDTTAQKTVWEKIKLLFMGVLSSAFVAYTTYELVDYFTNAHRLAVALAGISAFMGTDVVLIMGQSLMDLIRRKFEKH